MEENLNTLTAEEPTGLERLDAYSGTVVDSCRSGIFIRLEDGQDTLVFAYHGAPPRSRVLCALKNLGDPERNRLPRVVVESVLDAVA